MQSSSLVLKASLQTAFQRKHLQWAYLLRMATVFMSSHTSQASTGPP